MVEQRRSKRGQRGNIMILFTLGLPLFIGLVGLAVDATICFIAQGELSAALDGAALGTGRLMTTNANPNDIAGEFIEANFPGPTTTTLCTGCATASQNWYSYNITPTITVVTGISKTVTITATAQVPLMFMRLFNQQYAVIAAGAKATRRDARIEVVIDRSGSMNNTDSTTGNSVISELVTAAQGFVEQFTEGYDEMGLVVFDGSGVVGYPTTPWPAPQTYNGGGGPDTSFYDTTNPNNMVNQIGVVTADNGTGMGDALAIAYLELQKAHMRDMAANGSDTRMNAIVLFTDGVPSAASTYMNSNAHSVINSNPKTSGGSGCTYATDTATPTNPMYGWVVQASGNGNPPYTTSYGFFQMASLDSSNSSTWYMSNPGKDYVFPYNTTPETGCNGNTNGGGSANNIGTGWNPLANLTAIPSYDRFGYSLGPNMTTGVAGYLYSSFTSGSSTTSIYQTSKGGWSPNMTSSANNYAYQWGLASWDEVDNVAEAIRSDSNYVNRSGDTAQMSIAIYTIGYTGNGGTDAGLLTKIANVPACTINGYSCVMATEPQGMFVEAGNQEGLNTAFDEIAGALLRLSR